MSNLPPEFFDDLADEVNSIPERLGAHNGEQSAPWDDPLPLVTVTGSKEYPIDALPETIRAAVNEVVTFTQVPAPLAASSALGALSLAAQAYTDVRRARGLDGPSSLFLLTIADSGERKTTCDRHFMKAIHEYQREQRQKHEPVIRDYAAERDAWESERNGIKAKITSLTKAGNPTSEQRDALRELQGKEPEPPRVPHLIYGDFTPEALRNGLARTWPSAGVMLSEAGAVLGSHGMGTDSVMRNLSMLNILWDGGCLPAHRASVESHTVEGARLTMSLQVQESTLRSFFERTGGLARGTGFLARFLLAWPDSTQGTRHYAEPPEHWPAMSRFNRRVTEILNQTPAISDDGRLDPPLYHTDTGGKSRMDQISRCR